VSTLNYSDIQTADQMGYNPEAVKFQFDFLNDDYDFLPKGLRNAIEGGKEIIVLMNPPYGRANEGGRISTVSKNSTITSISTEMGINRWGKCSAQLYSQFLYRTYIINKLSNIHICLFSPPLFYVGDTFKDFREKFFKSYKQVSGFLMKSSNFADVKEWPLTFSILKTIKNV
jgi:hypothetical protein